MEDYGCCGLLVYYGHLGYSDYYYYISTGQVYYDCGESYKVFSVPSQT